MNVVPYWIDYNPNDDVLTINGHKIARQLLEQITTSPCGVSYRVIERKDGVVTIAYDRNEIEAAAADMLAALQEIIERNEIQHWFNLDQARAAVAKAIGAKETAA
jgi:hypothetical protein